MTPARHYIEALVCGYPKPLRYRRRLVVLQAVIDDSGQGHGPVFVLAGFVLEIHGWLAFADAWQALLETPPKLEYFKTSEAVNCDGQFKGFSVAERDKRVQEFVSLVLSHRPLAVRHVVPNDAYARVFKGKFAKSVDYPYFLSFHDVIGTVFIHLHSQDAERSDQVDFVFDSQSEKQVELVRQAWSFGVQALPQWARRLVGNRPDHRDDKIFVPLQAADLVAWHVRRSHESTWPGPIWAEIWRALCSLEWAKSEMSESRLSKVAAGLEAAELVFEYDLPPKLRKFYKRAMLEKFRDFERSQQKIK